MLKKWRITLMLGVAIAISVLISACGGSSTTTGSTPTANPGVPGQFTCVSGSITASGSTALQPFVDAAAKKYESKCPSVADVENGISQIGDSDVPALSTQTDLVDHQVAIVIFVMIVNPDVTGVKDIKTSDIIGIYTGKITNWKQIGGPDKTITVISRPTTSGTRATFKKYVLGGVNESPAKAQNLTVDSTGTVIQTVAQTSGSIGYVTLGGAQAAGSSVVILKIDGQDPTPANVATNAYKFWNIEHMYTKGQPSGLTQAFLNYMTSPDANTIAESLKFVKISDVPADIRATHSK